MFHRCRGDGPGDGLDLLTETESVSICVNLRTRDKITRTRAVAGGIGDTCCATLLRAIRRRLRPVVRHPPGWNSMLSATVVQLRQRTP